MHNKHKPQRLSGKGHGAKGESRRLWVTSNGFKTIFPYITLDVYLDSWRTQYSLLGASRPRSLYNLVYAENSGINAQCILPKAIK
jgi:hypothetical protein